MADNDKLASKPLLSWPDGSMPIPPGTPEAINASPNRRSDSLSQGSMGTPSSPRPESAAMQKASWVDSTQILVGLIMGSGTLGLPYAMAQLGWVVGISVCVLFGLAAVYSGLCLSTVRNRFCPDAENFADVAQLVSGPWFGTMTKYAIWVNWTLLLPYYIMSTTRAIEVAIGKGVMCFPEVMLCIVAVLVVLVQFRTLHALRWLAGASGVAITVGVGLLLIDFGLYAAPHEPGGAGFTTKFNNTRMWPKSDAGVVTVYGSTASFIFAYQGQSVFLEIMREMKNSGHFPRAVATATAIMMTVYLIIITLSYLAKGQDMPDFAPDAATNRMFRRIIGGLVAFNLFSSYLLTNVPLALAIHEAVDPDTCRDFNGWRGRIVWFIITGLLLAFSYVVANAIPFFGSFQGIIGSALGAPILFGWPPAFFLLASRKYGAKMSWRDAILCRIFIFIIFPVCFCLGLYSSVRSLILTWDKSGMPFDCHPA
eukprot:m.45379 g.45379  ORF g.45379 m.45379 type:complete len:481 (-) comp6644_c0_seq1:38-1480(-)